MKTHKLLLFLLTGQLLASSLAAQTADGLVSAGRTCLTTHNLIGAYSNFNAAVTLSPTNETANVLAAATRILTLPLQPPGSNFLNRLGFTNTGRDLYNWTSAMPHDTNGSTIFPANLNSSEGVSFIRTNVIPALGASRTNLARITNAGFTLFLTADETAIESVTLDYGDILLLRAELYAAEFLGYTLSAHNFSVVINHLKDLGNANPSQLSIQRVLADYPSLLTQASAADLANSKAALTNAIAIYQQASDFIRNIRPGGAVRLFNLETNDLATEAQFRDYLAKTLQSLNGPVQFNTNEVFSLYAGAYFAGTKSLRSLVPQFNGNRYVNNTLPDYTFGGFLVNEPACDTESLLREKLGRSYAGIYSGLVYDLTFGDSYAGVFSVFVNTNQQATVVGYDYDSFQNIDGEQSGGVAAQFPVDEHGNWEFDSNSVAGVSGYGSVSDDGWYSGQLNFTNGDSVWLEGYKQPALGPFQNAAGNYSGTWSGTYQGQPVSGTLKAVLSADGQLVFCIFHNGAQNDGGQGQFDSNNQFTTTDTASGNMISCTLTNSTLQIGGTATAPSLNVKWTLSRSTKLPFDVPPVITTPPQSKIVPLGTNVTFSLVATGSPPLCYQWFSNDVAIAKATNTSLVLSNVQWASAGIYSVSVRNVVGEADATASLLVSSLSTAMLPVATNANVVEVSFGLASDGTNYLVGFSSGTNVCAQLVSSNGTRIGSALILGGGAGVMPPQAQVVSGSTNYLVVWSDTTISSGVDIFGQFISRSGAKIGSKFPLLQSLGSHGFQAIESLASDGTNYLVVWMDEANLTGTGTSASYGQLVTAAGALSGSEFVVAQVGAPNPAVGVTVAFGKTNYLATWQSGFYIGTNIDGHYTTYGAFITPGGAVGDTFPISQTDSPDNNFSPGMAFDGANYLVVWNRNIGTPSSGTNNQWTQYGRLVSADGTFPGNEMLMSAVWSMMPSLAFDGSDYLMAWSYNTLQTSRNIHFRFFDRSANPLGTEFVLFSAQGTNAPLSPWNGVIFDGKQYAIAATLGVLNVINNKSPSFPSAQVYAAFLPASGGATTPTILEQPLSQINATGTVVRFTVTAAGLPPLGCQWQKNGTNLANGARISGVTAGSLTVSNLAMTDAGNYSVIVGNSFGSVTSSNAVLTVFIPDTTKPTVTISSPTANQHWSNEVFTVTGKAGDNVSVANVFYSLNGSGWAPAVTANNWSNWTAQVTLVPGTNTIQACAVDTVGNFSTTNKVSLVYILSAPLTVSTNGNGSISPNYNGALLQIGSTYTMTATASAGFGFTGWTGSSTTNGATLKFLMASNLTFTANFSPIGTYSGGPIRIRSDDQFTGTNGVVSGSGTQVNPYIIEGWTIDASSCDTSVWPYTKVGIAISETSKYFVIRDCQVENAREYGVGISLSLLSNGRVENSVLTNSNTGIGLDGVSNVVISGNTIENCGDGISNGSYSSDGVTISNNTITGCTDTGIDFHYLINSSASGNTVTNNSDGIEVFDASACTISNNIVQGNTWTGIDVDTDGFENNINIISYNDTSGNGAEGIYVTCSHNTISHNTSNGNGAMGIRLDYVALTDITASYNTVSNNTANNNSGDGLFVGSSCDYNTISNNTANNNVMNGIEVQGDFNTISSNTAFSNNALGRYDPDGYPWYYDIMISSPLPNTNTLEGNAYGTIYIY